MTGTEGVRVMVVDDDEALTEVYAAWLADRYDVTTATAGDEALDALDDRTDVVLLDRRMPDLPGEAVLDAIRDRGIDCRVAMVTGVRPDEDVLDMGFDDYLVKPVTRDDLVDTVERLRERATYDDRLQTYYSLASKRAALEAEANANGTDADADDSVADAIDALDERLESLQAEMRHVVGEFGFDDFQVAFRDVTADDDD